MRFVFVGLAAVAIIVGWRILVRERAPNAYPIPGEGTRFTVEVLNGTRVDGLARTVTRRLRSSGIDVVFFGSALDSTLDSTNILIRRGDSAAALVVRDVLGTGRIITQLDSSRLVDVTVILRLDVAASFGLHP